MKSVITLAEHLRQPLGQVNDLIRQCLQSDVAMVSMVADHLINAGGKRVRPLLCLASAELCGYTGDKAQYLAAAVEFIHSATLLHDDVVDYSLQRRGKPTANAMYGNKMAILVGDFLFSQSFQLMVKSGNMQCLNLLARASSKLAEGEVLQLVNAQNLAIKMEDFIKIQESKTAVLFASAMESVALLAGVPPELQKILHDYGNYFGVAFQMIDDIMDYFGHVDTMGKNAGDDFFEGKISLPLILTYQQANETERAWLNTIIKRPKRTHNQLAKTLKIMAKYNIKNLSWHRAEQQTQLALAGFASLPASPIKNILSDLAHESLNRLT